MRELVKYPDNRLLVKSLPVQEFGSALTNLIEDMTYVMRVLADKGMGITAVQCGVHLRVALIDMDVRSAKRGKPTVICNPEILNLEGDNHGKEGCLSFPGIFYPITRPQLIRIRYRDEEGRTQHKFFHEMFARCILHEIDHMDGILFTDRAKEQGIEIP